MSRVTEADLILDATTTSFGFELKNGPGKTEVAIVLRGKGKQATLKVLSQCERGEGHDRIPTLPIANGIIMSVVRNYKHVGAMAAASLRCGPAVATRVSASKAAESAPARTVCAEAKFPQQLRVNGAVAIQASLLYAAATWPELSAP